MGKRLSTKGHHPGQAVSSEPMPPSDVRWLVTSEQHGPQSEGWPGVTRGRGWWGKRWRGGTAQTTGGT